MNRLLTSQNDTHFRVLRILQDKPDITQRDVVSLGRVNYCLRTLTDKGMVKIQNFRNSKNKMSYLYLLTPHGISEKMALTESFLKRKIDEHEALKTEIEEVKAEFSSYKESGQDLKATSS